MSKISDFDFREMWRKRGVKLGTRDSSHRWATRKRKPTRAERKASRKFRNASKRRNR